MKNTQKNSTYYKKISYEIPKAELHVHIEGTMQPSLVLKLAKKHNVKALQHLSIEELELLYNFNNLKDFIELYVKCAVVLKDESDFEELMFMYLEKSYNQGLKYTEVFLDIQSLIYSNIDISVGINGLIKGINKFNNDNVNNRSSKVYVKILVCFLRDKPVKDALDAYEKLKLYKKHIIGIGLASNEYNYPPILFKQLFTKAKQDGYKLVAHAGEEKSIPVDYIYSAINDLKIDRMDHGVQIIKDNNLLKIIKDINMPLTLCPVSNYKLKVFDSIKDCPVNYLLKENIPISLNSDDPGMFCNFIGDCYFETGKENNFDINDYKTIAINSFNSAFISEEDKKYYTNLVNEYVNNI